MITRQALKNVCDRSGNANNDNIARRRPLSIDQGSKVLSALVRSFAGWCLCWQVNFHNLITPSSSKDRECPSTFIALMDADSACLLMHAFDVKPNNAHQYRYVFRADTGPN